jgi:hypothetical protein
MAREAGRDNSNGKAEASGGLNPLSLHEEYLKYKLYREQMKKELGPHAFQWRGGMED